MDELLGLLSANACVSGEGLCQRLGITRAAVWKRVEKLRAQGYDIRSAGRLGYRLVPVDNSLLPGYVARDLTTRWAGRGEIRYRAEMGSTNAEARELARAGAPQGSLALCDQQTAGRGRLGRAWVTPKGVALTVSVVLRPRLETELAQLCTLAAAVAACQAVEEVCGLTPGIKWPNDVVLDGRKLVGILSEMYAGADGLSCVVPGVGFNVNQERFDGELADKAVSLLMQRRQADPAARPICRRKLLVAFLSHLENAVDALEREGMAGIRTAYEARAVMLGREVRVVGAQESYTALALGVDDTGALLVRDSDGTMRRVLSGDVSVRGLMGYC